LYYSNKLILNETVVKYYALFIPG